MRKFLLLVAIILSAACSCAVPTDQNGHSYEVDGMTVLDLKGSWHQMGKQYGALAKGQMDDVLAYLDMKLGSDAEKLDSAARIADRLYANYPDCLKEFFDGASLTSGLSLERLKLCNAVEYVEGVFLCSACDGFSSRGWNCCGDCRVCRRDILCERTQCQRYIRRVEQWKTLDSR